MMRCSLSLASTNASVSCEPTSGMSRRSRSRYGTAPMWSSCPCVRTIASMSSRRSLMYSKSGRIRSTPGWWSSGNRTPQSMTSSRPAYSRTAMLRPTSPSPPSATTRRAPSAQRRRQGELGVRVTHGSPGGISATRDVEQPGGARPSRISATSSSVAGDEREAHRALGQDAQHLERGLRGDGLEAGAVECVDRGDDRSEDAQRRGVVAGVERARRSRRAGDPRRGR